MINEKEIFFNYQKITKENAWLLGFIFADATIGMQQKQRVIKLYNKNFELLYKIKEAFQLPYKITEQKNKNNTVFFIRISNSEFIKSVELQGFKEDKSKLELPKMTKACTKLFLKGFLKGKGSRFFETTRPVYGFKVIFRSESFINEIAQIISEYCNVKVAKPHCRKIVNVTSCQIKYVNSDCARIVNFIESEYSI